MKTVLLLILVSGMTLLGDYLIKLASSRPDGLASVKFALGAFAYGLPAFGWFFLMRDHSLATIGVFYSSATLILLAVVGVMAFAEPFGLRQTLGIGLAVAAVVVMAE